MRKRQKPRPAGYPIEIEVNGETYRGSYFVEKGMVTVSSPDGEITTQSSFSPLTGDKVLARVILRELIP